MGDLKLKTTNIKKEIYYATSNPGKFDEVKRFIEEHAPSIELKQFNEDLVEKQTSDAKSIAISKSKQAWEKLKKPILVDDSGIYFNQYHNFPGTMTRYVYEGIGYEGIFSLLTKDPSAYFLLYMVFIDENNLEIFQGKCEGKIIKPKNFDAPPGLPYDAIFLPDGSKLTYSQLRNTPDEKKYAYRLKAVMKFLEWFKNNY